MGFPQAFLDEIRNKTGGMKGLFRRRVIES
jgi:hypothetical protein